MLYIMRHGKTDWNGRHKLQGQTDIPLNEEGRQMAREAAEACSNVHFDLCYCSPLIRAKETAQIVLEGRNIEIRYDDRLREMNFGEYEGIENCFDLPDCNVRNFFFHPESYVADKGAESLDDLFARTGVFLEERVLPKVKEGKDILIMGHGAMNSSIVCRIKDMPREKYWSEGIENCKLMRLL
ncbi:MAG: histidine phosphatase family protein [Lachnospiraceae bacterium]|nr:histidine phosphatase family protein [Lachnospiraceae bacterium]